LMTGLSRGGRDALVADFQRPQIDSVDVNTPLMPAMTRLREAGIPCLQVVEAGQPVGLLTLENIGEYLMVRTALAGLPTGESAALAESYSS
jgi:signal-transduction protein with cAMP-binding, CBS, and nucleotidyltransferase domain